MTAIEQQALLALIALARTTHAAADEGEVMPDGRVILDSGNAVALSCALDALDDLPDDQPGYTMSGPMKAEWALRGLLKPAESEADKPWWRDNEATYCLLMLVSGHSVPEEAVAGWTDEECQQAEAWASAVHAVAGDNEGEVPPMPACVAAHPEKPQALEVSV